MDTLIPSILSNATTPTSLVLLMFLLVVTGMLVPRWRYTELKDELDEYKQSTKSILTQLQDVSAQLEGNRSHASTNDDKSGGD